MSISKDSSSFPFLFPFPLHPLSLFFFVSLSDTILVLFILINTLSPSHSYFPPSFFFLLLLLFLFLLGGSVREFSSTLKL